jgi:hypothetical protein
MAEVQALSKIADMDKFVMASRILENLERVFALIRTPSTYSETRLWLQEISVDGAMCYGQLSGFISNNQVMPDQFVGACEGWCSFVEAMTDNFSKVAA